MNEFQIYRSGSFWVAVGPDHQIDANLSIKGVGRTPEEAVHLLLIFPDTRRVWREFGIRKLPTIADFKVRDDAPSQS